MTLIDVFLLSGLIVGVMASAGFSIVYASHGNLNSKVAHQILSLNIAIALTMSLSIAHGLQLLSPNLIFLLQGILLVFIDIALLYQFVMLKQARKLSKQQQQVSNDYSRRSS